MATSACYQHAHIRGVARHHLGADRASLAVDHDGQDHLLQIGPVVLGVAVSASVSPPSPSKESEVVSMNTTERSVNRSRWRANSASSISSLIVRGEKGVA